MSIPSIYLDHCATTPMLPAVAQVLAESWESGFANPASSHTPGRKARQLLEDAREGIAEMLGARLSGEQPDRVLFTSGGTESNNLALFGHLGIQPTFRQATAPQTTQLPAPDHSPAHSEPGNSNLAGESGKSFPCTILSTSLEHPSLSQPVQLLAREGWQVVSPPVQENGQVDADALVELIDQQTRLVLLMLGNNETGALQPVAQVAEVCRKRGVPLHTDAVQVVGKLPVDFHTLGVASLSAAAHKFHGPRGLGLLLVRGDVQLSPQLFGGAQQHALRPGTEPVALAVATELALRLWFEEQQQRLTYVRSLRDRFEQLLTTTLPQLVVHAQAAERLPHISCIGFPGIDGPTLLMSLDLAGVACSLGSACASGSHQASPALLAAGVSKSLARSSLRFSFAQTNRMSEVDQAVQRILSICKGLRLS